MQEEARCWYYVDKDNTPQGPVTAASIRGMYVVAKKDLYSTIIKPHEFFLLRSI